MSEIVHSVITVRFKCNDESIQELMNKFYQENEDNIEGMSYFQFKDRTSVDKIKRLIDKEKK